MKRACVILADGFEEVEAIAPIDYLRRAGIEVVVAGLGTRQVTGAHDIRVDCDVLLHQCGTGFDAVVVPGGLKGTAAIAADSYAVAFIKSHFETGRVVAAICAAPVNVLRNACGILEGKSFTGHPDTEAALDGESFAPGRVVVDGNLVTSRAAGTAGEFAAAIVARLLGEAQAAALARKILLER